MYVLDLFERIWECPAVPSTEGRSREGVRVVGRDAAPPGVTRNRVPGRLSGRPTEWAHYRRPRSETRFVGKSPKMARMARREARGASRDRCVSISPEHNEQTE